LVYTVDYKSHQVNITFVFKTIKLGGFMLIEANQLNNAFDAFLIEQSRLERNFYIDNKKNNGVYLTNDTNVIESVLECIPVDKTLLSKIFLEPSCGQGAFLIKLIIKIYLIAKDEKVVEEFIENNLYFVDIDPQMIEVTKKNINELYCLLFGKLFLGKFNSYCIDFTLIQSNLMGCQDNSIFNLYEKIDYVVGNPPYVALYGRRDKKQSEGQRIYYLENYNQFPKTLKNGKINYIMLFIEHGIKFLKKGGRLSFIIDLSFFETAYKYCRKYIVQRYSIKSLTYNLKCFEDVGSGQVILEISKDEPLNNKVKVIDAASGKMVLIPQENWNTPQDEYKFRISHCNDSDRIVEIIFAKKDPTLYDLNPKKNLRTCVMLLDMENIFTGTTPQHKLSTVKSYPYYRGSGGLKHKYSKLYHEKYFYYDKFLQDEINDKLKDELILKGIKNKKRIGLGETIIYDNPKVYIRQSAKELIATFDKSPSSANSSLYVFSLRDDSEESVFFLKYLCGLINSKIYTFFAQQRRIIRYNKGKQPQIKISDLYQIFIPNNIELQEKIVSLVDRIYSNQLFLEKSKSEIDVLLYQYYDLSDEQIMLISNLIEDFS
jgi:TaqI-like C-terminal specificity domain/N-6 DNA Methylase